MASQCVVGELAEEAAGAVAAVETDGEADAELLVVGGGVAGADAGEGQLADGPGQAHGGFDARAVVADEEDRHETKESPIGAKGALCRWPGGRATGVG